jgi:endonuclease YncB( thermonuclease family)
MADTIRGPVTRVIDGDTFEMTVTHVGKNNKEEYNDNETVRLAGVNAPELGTQAGEAAKDKLQRQLSGKEVRCAVQARDTYGRVVADVTIL